MNGDRLAASVTEQTPQVCLLEVSRGRMRNNNYLIIDPVTERAVLLDPAWQIDLVHALLMRHEVVLAGILLTHSHFDHIDLARPLAQFYNCPIWMSEQEIEASNFSAPQLVAIDERPWLVGKMLIKPILTPGHTPGCVCYWIGDNLFTGDVLFVEGCGICPDEAAAYAMYHSLEMLKARLHLATRIYPGHTYVRPPGLSFEEVLHHNMYLHFSDEQTFAGFRLRKGQSVRKLMSFR